MATFSLDIADEDVGRVLNAVAANYNRPEQIPNPDYPVNREQGIDEDGNLIPLSDPVDENGDIIPPKIDNPENKAVFTHRIVRSFLSEHVSAYERRLARDAALDGIDTTITLSDSTPAEPV